MERSWIGLGSNLGDREQQLAGALHALAATPGIEGVRTSRLYETDAVGPPPQGPYLNAAAELEVELSARALLERLLQIESQAGRVREPAAPRWSARTLDLDLLLYGAHCIDEPGLVVPHPRLHEREFVLVPFEEIAAEVRHPRLRRSIGELAGALGRSEAVRLFSGETI